MSNELLGMLEEAYLDLELGISSADIHRMHITGQEIADEMDVPLAVSSGVIKTAVHNHITRII